MRTMKSVMTLWKVEPLKCRGLPLLPLPFSPGKTGALSSCKISISQPFQNRICANQQVHEWLNP